MAHLTPLPLLLLRLVAPTALVLLASGAALAQWQWVDSTGRKVFSDTAPPAGTPEKNILKAPGARVAPSPATSSAVANAGAAAVGAPSGGDAAPKLTGREESLQAQKKQAEEAEQTKKKAEEQRLAKVRADNCDRAKRAKITLDSGIRIATTNAKGEREVLDEKGRAAEAQRIDDMIRKECAGPQ